MKYFVFIFLAAFVSCSNDRLFIETKNVQEIEVSNTADSTIIKLNKPNEIASFMQDCLNDSRREVVKFLATYRIKIRSTDTMVVILANPLNLKVHRKTYKSNGNIDSWIHQFKNNNNGH